MNSALQEAAAWREIARELAEGERHWLTMRDSFSGVEITTGMAERWEAHNGVNRSSAARVGEDYDEQALCLRALFFALECEDEARSASTKKRAVEVGKPRSER